jgi:hypothetical protein
MVARQVFGGPQWTVCDARMHDGEIAIAKHARFGRHLLIGQNGPLRIGCELGAGRRRSCMSGDCNEQTGEPLLHGLIGEKRGAQSIALSAMIERCKSEEESVAKNGNVTLARRNRRVTRRRTGKKMGRLAATRMRGLPTLRTQT